ncbi:MAG TPA: phosphohistidine phosphatase SixA [Solirubrobacteraceae bacterium]|jgi:phosphohistidine phosphatase
MARQLWLLRHAEAEPHGSRSDAERRLTERGERQARAAGVALERIGMKFEAVLFSPKVRARQTAELAAEAWSARQRKGLREHAALAGAFDAAQALDALAEVGADGCLLLVGHEPDLSQVAGELTGGRVDLKKGGVAAVRLEGAGGELAALMRPRELLLIARVPAGGD